MSLLTRCIRCLGSTQIRTLGNLIVKCTECLGIGFKEIPKVIQKIEKVEDEIEYLVTACEKKFKKAEKNKEAVNKDK